MLVNGSVAQRRLDFPTKTISELQNFFLPSSHSPTHTHSLSHQHSLFLFFSLSSSLFLPLPPFFPSICCICCILSTSVVSHHAARGPREICPIGGHRGAVPCHQPGSGTYSQLGLCVCSQVKERGWWGEFPFGSDFPCLVPCLLFWCVAGCPVWTLQRIGGL